MSLCLLKFLFHFQTQNEKIPLDTNTELPQLEEEWKFRGGTYAHQTNREQRCLKDLEALFHWSPPRMRLTSPPRTWGVANPECRVLTRLSHSCTLCFPYAVPKSKQPVKESSQREWREKQHNLSEQPWDSREQPCQNSKHCWSSVTHKHTLWLPREMGQPKPAC